MGEEAAPRVRRSAAIVHKGGRPVDVDPTHRRGLRDRPEFAAMAAGVRGGHVDGQVRQRPPEVIERDAVVGAKALVVDVDGPVDDNITRGEAETRYGGVATDMNGARGRTGP